MKNTRNPIQQGARRSFLRLAAGTGAATLGAGLLAACGGGGGDDATESERASALQRTINGCTSKAARLVDKSGMAIGYIDFINDGTNAYIAVFTADNANCPLRDLKLWLGKDLASLPVDGTGAPRLADLPLQKSFSGSEVSHEFVVPLSALGVTSAELSCAGTPPKLYLVGEVTTACASGSVLGYDTPNSAAAYTFAGFTMCCADTPVVLSGCETAFAKGGWVFVTDNKANPEGLPSLGLSRNRWGWAINLTAPGTATYPIYAGAGLNKVSSGKQVGTLTVSWNGTQATVSYALAAGVVMTEAHLYAGDDRPTTIAPGQYGGIAYFTAPASAHTFTVDLADRNRDGVWLIAHAVVCKAA